MTRSGHLTLTKDYVTQGVVDFKDCFKKCFKVTNNKKDYVTSESILQKIHEDMTMSSMRLCREIFKLLPAGWRDEEKRGKKRIGKSSVWCYFGIEEINPDEENYSGNSDVELEG